VYRCKNCGYVLHYLQKVGQDYVGIPSINEVMSKNGYICPKCKTKLTKPSQNDILITTIGIAKKRTMLPVKIGGSFYVPMSLLNGGKTQSEAEEEQ
jgi:rubredoxin